MSDIPENHSTCSYNWVQPQLATMHPGVCELSTTERSAEAPAGAGAGAGAGTRPRVNSGPNTFQPVTYPSTGWRCHSAAGAILYSG